MTGNVSEKSFTRFIFPVLLIFAGIATLHSGSLLVGTFTAHQSMTIGFALFVIGAFSFVLIINEARNPLISKDGIKNGAQALVVYGGLLTILVYESVFTPESMLVATGVVLVLGTAFAVISNSLRSNRD